MKSAAYLLPREGSYYHIKYAKIRPAQMVDLAVGPRLCINPNPNPAAARGQLLPHQVREDPRGADGGPRGGAPPVH